MPSLDELRKGLDSIDDDIARLLNKRAELVLEVKKAKEQGNIDIYSSTRERQILDRVSSLVPGGQFPRGALERIFQSIIGASRSLIGQLNVSYVAPQSSLDHQAAVKQFGEDLALRSEANLDEVFAKVESGDSHYGLAPARTSAGSMVKQTYDRLLQSPLVIIAEVEIRERLALLGEGSGITDVQQIFSDAASFQRSFKWLRMSLASAHLQIVDNTDLAMKMAEGDRFSAAVALEGAGDRYNLRVLANGIESDTGGDAQFFVVGKKGAVPTGNDKTSLACGTAEKAGALREVLRPFSENGINLLKIESRSMQRNNVEHMFFLDAVGHKDEPKMAAAIAQLGAICPFVHVLGSYPLVCQS